MKRVLLFLLSASSLMANDAVTALVRSQKGYNLQMGNVNREIKSYDVDARIRSMNGEQLGRLAAIGGLKAHKMSNGDYRIEIGGGLKGGGAFGAWLGSTLGYGAVTFAGHGAIHLVSLCTGPLYVPVSATLTKMLAVPIHAAACTAGVAGGLAVGVATGPV